MEALCTYIFEFIQMKEDGTLFEFDEKATKEANIGNAFNFILNRFCKSSTSVKDIKTKIISEFFAAVFGLIRDKKASDGKIDKFDFVRFMIIYGEYATCEKLSNSNMQNIFVSIPQTSINSLGNIEKSILKERTDYESYSSFILKVKLF